MYVKSGIKIALGSFILSSVAMAGDVETDTTMDDTNRDRISSVRKVVDSVGKLETKEVSLVDEFKHMFSDGKVSGQVRAMYAGYNQDNNGDSDTYASALGGILKYELAQYYGFNAGVAVYTSHDISSLSGGADEHNPELSSSNGSYTEMAEAYLNYNYKDFNFRAGRQILNTPLADSDDIRIIQNTFEAYVASYTYNGIAFMAGYIDRWQGVDADLDEGWVDAGDKTTMFAGISSGDTIEYNAWYYGFENLTDAIYLDIGIQYPINKDLMIHAAAQYLNESEVDNSGYGADIYGALLEFVAYDLGLNIAYDFASKQDGQQSYSGNGGGSMFTSMDTIIIDEIANDRDATAIVAGLSYEYNEFGFLYAYGDFSGEKNSVGEKAHITEQDIGAQYNVNDEFLVAVLYSIVEDKEHSEKTEYDWSRTQLMVNYSF